MKLFARRVEAPTPEKPYATKWQAVWGYDANDPNLRYFDVVHIDGLCTMQISEESNPAIYILPSQGAHVIGIKDGLAARLR